MNTRTVVQQIEFMRNVLAFCLIAAFVGALMLFSFKGMPDVNKDIITYMVGQLSGMATMALGFYFVNKAGQDAADAEKTANTGKLADAFRATAEAASKDGAEALRPGDTVKLDEPGDDK